MSPAPRIYLDHNATTPLHPEVVEVMRRVLQDDFGNPSSTHTEGARARARVEQARDQVAACLRTEPGRVVFTGGATEANNTVLLALLEHADRGSPRGGLVTTTVEHPSVIAPAERLRKAGVPVRFVRVDREGRVDVAELLAAVDADTALVSLIWANNETGVVQPVDEIAAALAERGIPLHVDATQAVGKWTVDLSRTPIGYLSCSAHKLNGPKGVGCLVAGGSGGVIPLLLGGPQEKRLRGGTENVPGIAGFGQACELASAGLAERMQRYAKLRDRLWSKLSADIEGLVRNGSTTHVLPNTLNIEVAGVAGDVLVEALDLDGVAASAGAACHSGSVTPSHVLVAMGLGVEQARSSLRLSVGLGNDEGEIDRAASIVADLVARARSVGAS